MKDNNQSAKSASDKTAVMEPPVRVPDVEMTPKAEAKAANKLPRTEQMKKFETDLEAHDSGNQPA